MRSFAGEVVLADQFQAGLRENGFSQWKSGTWRSDTAQAYLYRKRGGLFTNQELAQTLLSKVREYTARGLLSPGTRWGITKNESGTYQLFAVTRTLTEVQDAPPEKWQALSRPLGNELYKRAGIPVPISEQEMNNPESPTYFIDPGEASHTSNWAWSESDQMFYPIDVEVILLNAQNELEEDNKAAIAIESAYQEKLRPSTIQHL